VVSAIKRSNDGQGVVVRVYNPLSRVVEATIRPGFSFTRAQQANLLEERQETLPIAEDAAGREVQVQVGGGGITTLIFS
jgi:alpha-mannosidase